MEWLVPIAVAIITGPVVVLLQKLRNENTSQHAESRGILQHLVVKVEMMDMKLDDHIKNGHADKKETV